MEIAIDAPLRLWIFGEVMVSNIGSLAAASAKRRRDLNEPPPNVNARRDLWICTVQSVDRARDRGVRRPARARRTAAAARETRRGFQDRSCPSVAVRASLQPGRNLLPLTTRRRSCSLAAVLPGAQRKRG